MPFRSSLGEFETLALLAILKLGRGAYGTSIRHEIESATGREVTIGALYTTFNRLEKKGLIESEKGEATPERGGRAKRYFELTLTGQQALQGSISALQRLGVGQMIPQEA